MAMVAGGPTISVHMSAMGKVLLAHAGPRVIDEVCSIRESSSTAWCSTRFRSELEATRLRGLGYDVESSDVGLCSVAAPIRDSDGRVYTALGITAPALSFRRNREMLSRSVQRAAVRISRNARVPERESDLASGR
jgi:DNA-binding IclR family transcriptional regulator